MKILLVTSDRYPVHRPAAKVIFGRELVERGHEIDWLLRAEENESSFGMLRRNSGTFYIARTDPGCSWYHRVRKQWYDLKNDLKIFSLAWLNDYDFILVKDKYVAGILALIASRFRNALLVYWIAYPLADADVDAAYRGTARYRWIYWVRGKLMKLLLYRVLLPNSAHVFVQSEQMKKDFLTKRVPLHKMTAVPGSIDMRDVPFDRAQLKQNIELAPGGSIVYLGTLIRIRRLEMLFEALAVTRKRHPDARLYFLGKGDLPDDEIWLRSEARRLGLSHAVEFVGHLPMEQAWQYVRAADVCVSPYYPTPILNSTSPTKLIEYMAMGKPVVGNHHPEQSEVLAASGAGICVNWDATEFGDAISEILDDPESWKARGERGRRFVEANRTNTFMATRVEDVFKKLLEQSRISK